MFNNIGQKIKILAIVSAGLESIGSIVAGLCMEDGTLGVLIAGSGVILSVFSLFLLYGFGELIENTSIIIGLVKKLNDRSMTLSVKDSNIQTVSNNKSQKSQKHCPYCFHEIGQADILCNYCGRKLE